MCRAKLNPCFHGGDDWKSGKSVAWISKNAGQSEVHPLVTTRPPRRSLPFLFTAYLVKRSRRIYIGTAPVTRESASMIRTWSLRSGYEQNRSTWTVKYRVKYRGNPVVEPRPTKLSSLLYVLAQASPLASWSALISFKTKTHWHRRLPWVRLSTFLRGESKPSTRWFFPSFSVNGWLKGDDGRG